MPAINRGGQDKIVEICNLVNMGEMNLTDEIVKDLPVYEMLTDLKIDYNE